MLKLLTYLLGKGVVTQPDPLLPLSDAALGMPGISTLACIGESCKLCRDACPTDAIRIMDGSNGAKPSILLDRGACINCSLCIDFCPTKSIVSDRDPRTAARTRDELILNSSQSSRHSMQASSSSANPFKRSIACRVVSTGCSACDQEISAAGNPFFDMERFGVHVVASPRFADVLLVTGPVPRAMHDPLKRCYEAMAEPRRVIAVGTCACSGGVHRGGYTEANGVSEILPVDVFIPGCPPHPKSIIAGLMLLMDRLPPPIDRK